MLVSTEVGQPRPYPSPRQLSTYRIPARVTETRVLAVFRHLVRMCLTAGLCAMRAEHHTRGRQELFAAPAPNERHRRVMEQPTIIGTRDVPSFNKMPTAMLVDEHCTLRASQSCRATVRLNDEHLIDLVVLHQRERQEFVHASPFERCCVRPCTTARMPAPTSPPLASARTSATRSTGHVVSKPITRITASSQTSPVAMQPAASASEQPRACPIDVSTTTAGECCCAEISSVAWYTARTKMA